LFEVRGFRAMPTANRAQHRQAILMLLLANLFWGVSFPAVKAMALLHEQLLPGVGAWYTVSLSVAPRFLLAALVLLLWQGRRVLTLTRGELTQGGVIGLFSATGMLLQTDGLRFTPASTSAFLTQFYAILIPIYVAVRSRRNPGVRVWFSSALVLVGVAILGRFSWQNLGFGRGEWETLASSLFFMGQILWLEKHEYAANRPGMITLVVCATIALIFGSVMLATAPDAAALVTPWTSPPWLGFTLILTIFCTLGAFSLMNAWQPKITATEAGLIYSVEPIFGSLMALYLPAVFSVWAAINYANEQATWNLLVGGGFITFANVLIQLRPSPQLEQAEARANL
jgi:drug/metabolite transporter (DMT)-like permease